MKFTIDYGTFTVSIKIGADDAIGLFDQVQAELADLTDFNGLHDLLQLTRVK